jgi:hypothetical protein
VPAVQALDLAPRGDLVEALEADDRQPALGIPWGPERGVRGGEGVHARNREANEGTKAVPPKLEQAVTILDSFLPCAGSRVSVAHRLAPKPGSYLTTRHCG